MPIEIGISTTVGGIAGNTPGGTPPFSNVNSFLFDGVDEKMFSTANYTEINGTQNFSVSFWLKPIDSNDGLVFRFGTQGSTNRLACIYYPSLEIVIISFGTSSYYYRSVNGSIPLNQWSHIVYTYNGTQSRYNRPEIYVNGVLSQGTNTGVINSQSYFDGTLELGGTGTSGQQNFGNNYIDEFAVWNSTTLTQTQANELYNGGTPSDLNNIASGLAQPTTWFRMGEEATWNGATWTMTDVNGGTNVRAANMQESSRTTDVPTASSFTNTKSILLDGFDDFVDCGSISSINSASIVSISMWVKKSSSNNVDASVGSLVNNTNGIWLNWYTDNTLYFTVRNGAFMTTSYALSGDTNWHNIVGVYNGVNSKIYVDGSLVATGSNVPSSLSPSAGSNFQIGALNGGSLTSGNIDEVSIFNTELSQSDVTTIWNNGVPSDISSINGITNWWRCGDGDTAPTLTDNGSGGNDGTMQSFTTFSTDVPT